MQNHEFKNFERLLPEYVNGSLPDNQIIKLENAIQKSAGLQNALRREYQLRADVIRLSHDFLEDIICHTEIRLQKIMQHERRPKTAHIKSSETSLQAAIVNDTQQQNFISNEGIIAKNAV